MSLLLLLLHVYVYHPTIIYTYSITYHWISRKCNITKIENIKEKKQKNSRTRNSDEFIPLFYLQPRPLACHTHKIDRNTKKMFEKCLNENKIHVLLLFCLKLQVAATPKLERDMTRWRTRNRFFFFLSRKVFCLGKKFVEWINEDGRSTGSWRS